MHLTGSTVWNSLFKGANKSNSNIRAKILVRAAQIMGAQIVHEGGSQSNVFNE
jgi:hypothetical protein